MSKKTIKLFCYGTLNVHSVQRQVWGEAKDGVASRVTDYEVKMWDNSTIMYATPQIGESITGKVYELTPEQIANTDVYEGNAYRRETVYTQGKDDVEIYVKNEVE